MSNTFCPIDIMPYGVNMIQSPCGVNMIQIPYVSGITGKIIDYSKVVHLKYTLYLLFKYNSNENLNLFICFIQYETLGYYLCILDMTTNMSYYLRYDADGIYYCDNNDRYHEIDIPYNIPWGYDDFGNYIGVNPCWAYEHVLFSTNGKQPVRIGNYFMYNTRALTPEPIPVATQVFTESPIIPVVKAVIVENICNILKSSETSINFESDSLLRKSILIHMTKNQELLFTMVSNNQEALMLKFLKILINTFNSETDNLKNCKKLKYEIKNEILKLYISK